MAHCGGEVAEPDLLQLQARKEGRVEAQAKFHQIQYTVPLNQYEWVLLYWPDRQVLDRRIVIPLLYRRLTGESTRSQLRNSHFAAAKVIQWRRLGRRRRAPSGGRSGSRLQGSRCE
jgi:hypothetical protein